MFLTGNAEGTLRLADEQIAKARDQGDTNALVEGLTWRGIALASKRSDEEADKAWAEAWDAAKGASFVGTRVQLLGMRSLWIRHVNPFEASDLWEQALAITTNADAEAAECGSILNRLGAAQPIDAPGAAAEAFRNAVRLLGKSRAPDLEQAVARYNLGVANLQLARFQPDPGFALSCLNEAKTNIETALQVFQTDGTNAIAAACCILQLSWLADSMDDQQAVKNWSEQFRHTVEGFSEAELNDVHLNLLGDYLLYVSPVRAVRGSRVVRSLSAGSVDANKGVELAFRAGSGSASLLPLGARFENLIGNFFEVRPLESFLEGWVLREGWEREGPIVPEASSSPKFFSQADGEKLKESIVNATPEERSKIIQKMVEGMGVQVPPTDVITNQERMKEYAKAYMNSDQFKEQAQGYAAMAQAMREKMAMMRTNPAGANALFAQQAADARNAQLSRLNNNVLGQLPGGSPVVPGPAAMAAANPSMMPAGNLFTPAMLEKDGPLPQAGARAVQLWQGTRSSLYGMGSNIGPWKTFSRDLTLGANQSMAQSAFSELVDAGENRAAWQVVEETRAIPERRAGRLRGLLTKAGNEQARQGLAAKQAASVEAYMQWDAIVSRAPGQINRRDFDQASALWDRSGDYDEAVRELEQNNDQPMPPLLTTKEAAQALPAGSIYISFASKDYSGHECVLLLDPRADRGNPEILVERIALPMVLALRFQNALLKQDGDPESLTPMGRQLFARLFPGEIGQRVRGASRVIISPPDTYWSFPFGALVINESGAPKYLGLEKAVSYTESIGLLKACRERAATAAGFAPGDTLVLGGCDFGRPEQKEVFEEFHVDAPLALPESADEARRVSDVYGAHAITGDDATEPNVRARIEHAPIIHIASHGYTGTAGPSAQPTLDMNSLRASMWAGVPGIWLTVQPPKNKPGFNEDGLLQAWEVKNQFNLQADLVVLSACDVGQAKAGTVYGPELPMAFLYAGAHSVVAVQAPANDRSTALLMPAFHQLIKQGIAKDEALRRALSQLQSNSEFAHPVYWAPFVLMGDPDNSLFAHK